MTDHSLFIHGATICTPGVVIADAAVIVEGDRIAWVGRADRVPSRRFATELDGRGHWLVPGFIDLQLNGAFGDDFTADPSSMWRVAEKLPRFGVTSFLPTIITAPLEQIARAQEALLRGCPAGPGAAPLGLHLEGPFLSPQKKGAHNARYLRTPDLNLVRDWSPQTGVRLVTLAPELPDALDVTRYLVKQGVAVSAGHSLATFAQAQAGFAAGMRYGTHLFNAMPPLAHREPGLAGALLATPGQVVGVIPDGIHVHPAVIRIAWAAKGPRGLNLVSDAMAALGMAAGRYQLNDYEVIVSKTGARLADGTLAGSVLALDQALRNLIAFTGCSLQDALATVTATPADVLGIGGERGRVRPGMIADLVLLTQDLRVAATITAGQVVWAKSGGSLMEVDDEPRLTVGR